MEIYEILKNKHKKYHSDFLERFELENGIKYDKYYRTNNLDKIKKRYKNYYIKNSEKIKERTLKYYYSNKINN